MILSSRAATLLFAATAMVFPGGATTTTTTRSRTTRGGRGGKARQELSRKDLAVDRLQTTCEWTQVGDSIPQVIGIKDRPGTKIGNSVALSTDGSTLAVGEEGYEAKYAGQVRIFAREEGETGWKQLGSKPLFGEDGGDIPLWDGVALDWSDEFGFSVALSRNGRTLAVGAVHNDQSGKRINGGHVRVFRYHEDTNKWPQIDSDLDGEAVNDYSGFSVALSGDGTILAIGTPFNAGNGSNAGHVRVYELVEGPRWKKMGADLDGITAGDRFGVSVSLSSDGKTLAVGGDENSSNGSSAGHVRLFKYYSRWTEEKSVIEGRAAGDTLGLSVALSANGKRLAIGAPQNKGSGNGYAVVYELTADNQWVQLGNDIPREAAGDRFGWSVSLSENGQILAVGALLHDGNGGSNSGQARVYKLQSDPEKWVQVGNDLTGEAANSQFGLTVSLSADGTSLAVESRSIKEYGRVFSISDSACLPDESVPPDAPSISPTVSSTRAPESPVSSTTSQTTSPTITANKGLPTGALVGAILGGVFFVAMVAGFVIAGRRNLRHARRGQPPVPAADSHDQSEPRPPINQSSPTIELSSMQRGELAVGDGASPGRTEQGPRFKDQVRNVIPSVEGEAVVSTRNRTQQAEGGIPFVPAVLLHEDFVEDKDTETPQAD